MYRWIDRGAKKKEWWAEIVNCLLTAILSALIVSGLCEVLNIFI